MNISLNSYVAKAARRPNVAPVAPGMSQLRPCCRRHSPDMSAALMFRWLGVRKGPAFQ